MLALYAFLRRLLSALLGLPPTQAVCRFTPTCSQYCHQALVRHGIIKGGCYCLWRLLRCQPFFAGGDDPVP